MINQIRKRSTTPGGWRARIREWSRDPSAITYVVLIVIAIIFPTVTTLLTGDNTLVGTAADAGVWVLLAIGLNVVVGFAGLLDLGYAAFFAIGAYAYALFASPQLGTSPIHHAFHFSFWLLLFVGMGVAALAGALLGAPTLRLRGDYLAIVTLGFGEIVPRVFRNADAWTGGINAIGAIDQPWLPVCVDGPWSEGDDFAIHFGRVDCSFSHSDPTAYYVLMVILIILCVILVTNLYRSRLGRAWMAVREDEVAASAMGINTRNIKLLAFAIGASFSGFAGAYYGSKLNLVSPDNFQFSVSITVLVMVVLGGMGNIAGVIVGSLAVYIVYFWFLTNLPRWAGSAATQFGMDWLNHQTPTWTGISDEVQRLNYIVLGLILVLMMLLRPQGLLPSRVRAQELEKGVSDQAVADVAAAGGD